MPSCRKERHLLRCLSGRETQDKELCITHSYKESREIRERLVSADQGGTFQGREQPKQRHRGRVQEECSENGAVC